MSWISKKKKLEQDKKLADQAREIADKDAQLKDRKAIISNRATATVTNFANIDADLELSPEIKTVPKMKDGEPVMKDGKVELEMKLVSAGNVFAGYSLEDALARGYGTTVKYINYYKATGVLRKCTNMTGNFTTRAGFETTIKCLDDEDDPEKPEYKEVKRKIDELNRKVNMDNMLFVSVIKRLIHGRAGWEIVTDGTTGDIIRLDPLDSAYIIPRLDKKGEFSHIEYAWAPNNRLPHERLIYFVVDNFEKNDTSLLGISPYRSIERNIKIKKNLERDMLYAARSLWAPIVIYQADTRGLTETEKNTLFTTLKADLRPGAIVITNSAVVSNVTQYNPDMNNLIRAIEMQDTEIIGSFGIPKALLSREKTMARATLEYSIRSFYESTIAGEQQYLGRQLEKQWYDPIVESLGYEDKIRIRHEWKPILSPAADLILALTRAGQAGLIDVEKFFQELGWQLDKVPEQIETEGEHTPPENEDEPTPPEEESDKDE